MFFGEDPASDKSGPWGSPITGNLRTKILKFRGFDSSRIPTLRDGSIMSIGDFPESLSRRNLVGIVLVGRLAVARSTLATQTREGSMTLPGAML